MSESCQTHKSKKSLRTGWFVVGKNIFASQKNRVLSFSGQGYSEQSFGAWSVHTSTHNYVLTNGTDEVEQSDVNPKIKLWTSGLKKTNPAPGQIVINRTGMRSLRGWIWELRLGRFDWNGFSACLARRDTNFYTNFKKRCRVYSRETSKQKGKGTLCELNGQRSPR